MKELLTKALITAAGGAAAVVLLAAPAAADEIPDSGWKAEGWASTAGTDRCDSAFEYLNPFDSCQP